MKKAHKIIALVAIMAMGMGSAHAQLSLGVKGGFNLSKMLYTSGNTTVASDWLPGFNAGLMVELGLTDMFTVEVDALLSRKGFKSKEFFGYTDHVYSPFYLDVPVNFKAYFDLGLGLRLYAQAGPYVGFGLFGNTKYITGGTTTKRKLNFGSENGNDLKMLDYGADVGAGVEFGKIQIGLMYWQGLANVAVNSVGDSKQQHRVLSLELGYKF